jgi:hypothetical protein
VAGPLNQPVDCFGGDMAAYEALEGMKQHLRDEPKLKLDGQTFRVGRKLAFDAQAERFIGDEQANQMLSRPYRKPYVVPEIV